jgi:Cu/Ag efflux protein CusF
VKNQLLFSALLSFAPIFAFANLSKSGSGECSQGQVVFCSVTDTPLASAETVKRHPLRGVITAVYADRGSIMVKHEEIPGVMRAMTMLFRVDAATLKSAEKGQTITAMMSRQSDEWWLHDVKVVAAAK